MAATRFKSQLYKIGQWTILRLPENVSAKLPSRGQVVVKGDINGFQFRAVLEPDGKWSHWLKVDKPMRDAAGIKAGDTVTATVESVKEWPEPELPKDWKVALTAHPQINNLWISLTPMARWEWIRWIRSTKNPETRKRHIEVSLSKLKAGERRPCCFNRAMCTDPDVSKSGVLLDATV